MNEREIKLFKIWKKTPKTMKAVVNEVRHILITKDGATKSFSLNKLTDEQIEEILNGFSGESSTQRKNNGTRSNSG